MAFGKVPHINNYGKVILLFVALVLIVVFAFLCEYITNDARSIPRVDRKIISIEELGAQKDGFSNNSRGAIISERANALISIQNAKGNVLHIQLKDKTSYPPVVTVGGTQIEPAISVPSFTYYSNYFSYDIHGTESEINITIPEEGVVIKTIEIDNRYHFNQYKFVYIVLLSCCILFFCMVLLFKYHNIEVIFLICSLTLTLMMSIMLPLSTTNTFDEEIHYARQASFLEENVTKYDMDLGNRQVPGMFDIDFRGEMNEELNNETLTLGDRFNVDVTKHKTPVFIYNRLAYAPSIVVTWFAKLFGFSFPITFIIGRAVNGIVYSFILFFAIRKLKSQKILMSVIGLTPLYIFQASTYTYDWWVTAFLMLGSAFLISEIQQPEKKVDWKTYFVIILSFVIGCGAKAIYCPILLTVLMLGKAKFQTRKYYWLNIGCIIVTLLVVTSTFMISFLVQGPGTGDARGGGDVNAAEQVSYILNEPLQYTTILINFLIGYVSPTTLAENLSQCGYLEVGVGGVLLTIIIVVASFTDRNQFDEHTLNTRNRLLSWGTCFVIICLFSSALYVAFTPVGLNTINGVQARYLMPLLFSIFTFVGSKHIVNRIRQEIFIVGTIGTTTLTTILVFGQLVVRNYY